MSNELASRLRKLQDAHDADVVDDDQYQTNLAKLRAQYGADAVDALLRQGAPVAASRSHTQQIGGYATIAAAIAGDFTGNLYIIGERAQSSTQALAGYLRWLASQCGQLPLRGVREQKAATDVLHIGLDQVYTQLATHGLVERETFEGEARKHFDAQVYAEQHLGTYVLPSQQRTRMRRHGPADLIADLGGDRDLLFLSEYEITHSSADDLAQYVATFHETAFFGPQLVTEAIATSPRLVLLGEPGSGKSTALRYLALTLARADLDDTIDLVAQLEGWQTLGNAGRLIPLFMPLLPLAQRLAGEPGRNGTSAELWKAIDAHLTNHGATSEIVAAMRAELVRGHVLLLLDGLDEVAGGNSRHQVVQAVQAFAAEQPQCRVVVACRVRAYEGEQNAAWQLPDWPSVTLADWTPGQVHAFISAWYMAAAAASHLPEARRDERIALLQRAAAEREDLRRLSVRPLLLTIMALVHWNDGRLPEDRVSLYARCLDILLGQWEIAGKDATDYGTLMQYIGLPDADVKNLRPLLTRVAYAAQQAAGPGEVGRLRRADLREMVADTLEQLKHPNPYEGAKRFLEYTDVRAGLLQATEAGDAYAFPHQTFQEYLAGLELISGVDFVDRIMERRGEDRWRVPIFLGIGHTVSEGVLSAPYQLLSRLLHASKRDKGQRQRDLVFAAELAEDVGWERLERGGEEFGALRIELAKALAQVVEGAELPAAERVHAGVLLGRLNDPREGVCTLPPAMVWIEGASFVIGSTSDELEQAMDMFERTYNQADKDSKRDSYRRVFQSELHGQAVAIMTMEIGRYPVTNGQFKLFVDEEGYSPDAPWWDEASRAWLACDDAANEDLQPYQRRKIKNRPEYWHDERYGIARPNHPVVGVSWYEVMAFCGWLTQHSRYNPEGYVYTLLSEAEWEYAARGMQQRPFAWGTDEPDASRANFNIYNGTTAVGCFALGVPPGRARIDDLAGNIWEWTRSLYRPYPYDPNDGRETQDISVNRRFIVRGGSWRAPLVDLRASRRRHFTPITFGSNIGFRLTRHPSKDNRLISQHPILQ